MPGHQQVEINGVKVDAGLERLLRVLWKRGIKTNMSCQRQFDDLRKRWVVWLAFNSHQDLERFVVTVYRNANKHLREVLEYHVNHGLWWDFQLVFLYDRWPKLKRFSHDVRFPAVQLKDVEEAFGL